MMVIDRSRLPTIGPDRSIHFPPVVKHRFDNGLELWSVEHRELPILSSALLLRLGTAADPPDLPGLAAFTTDMLDEGSGESTALELSERIARLGLQFDTEIGADATLLSMVSLAEYAAPALSMLVEMATRPRFDPEEVRRVRSLRLARLMQLRDVPSALADRLFAWRLYGNHPYGHASFGTEASLSRIAIEELREFHETRITRASAVLVMVGDASHDEMRRLAEAAFDGPDAADHAWGRATPSPDVTVAPEGLPPGAPRVAIIDRPGAAQSELRVGRVSAPRSTPDYHTLNVLNTAFGGSFVSRINLNLREQKAYTYGVRSSFDYRLGPGPFSVQTSVQTDATAESVSEILREMREVQDAQPITSRELERAQAALVRGFPRGFETADQIARAVTQLALYHLPDDYFDRYVPRIQAVTQDEVTAAARAHLRLDDVQVVVVGDKRHISDGLAELGLGAPIEFPIDLDPVLAAS
jgi:zinc protease